MQGPFNFRNADDCRRNTNSGKCQTGLGNRWGRWLADALQMKDFGKSAGYRSSLGARRPMFEFLEQRQLLTAAPHAVGFVPGNPESDIVSEQFFTDSISAAGEEDRFTIDLQAGQSISLLADGDVGLRPRIELLAPGGASLGVSTAASAAGQAGLEAHLAPSAGTYTIAVSGAGGTVGGYGVKVLFSATLESESYGTTANDTAGTAENLDSIFIELGGGVAALASVAGTLPGYSEGFESGHLDQRWRLETPPQAINELTGVRGAAEGETALLMRWNGHSNDLAFPPAAIWNVDLSELDNPELTFQAASWLHINQVIRYPFEGQDSKGTGVAISNDGYHWYPAANVLSKEFPDPTPWTEYSVDLAATAEAAGLSLDDELQIKFQRHTSPIGDAYDGVAYDAISISSTTENTDWYQFSLDDGQAVAIGYAGEQLGSATVELYDSNLNLLTESSATAFGERMIQPYTDATTNSVAETYYVKVAGKGTDYQLSVLRDPDFEVPGEFTVTGMTPGDGELVMDPTVYQVHVSHNVLATSLDASDLTIDGQAATGVRLVGGKTIEFTLPSGLTEKSYTAVIEAGAIVDIDGRGIPAVTSTFRPDVISPHVIAATLSDGDVVETGALEAEFQFNEPLLASVLDAGDVELVGLRTGTYAVEEFSYDASTSTLTLGYIDLDDDSYTLTLVSGENGFRDAAGHGLEGGDLEIRFATYVNDVPLSMVPIGPASAEAYAASVVGSVSGSSVDTYAVNLGAGQAVSVLLEPDSNLLATIEVLKPDGSVYATATAANVGESVTLQNIPAWQAGIYSIAVRGAGGSTGDYRLQTLRNAVHEDSTLDEATAENVDNWFLPLSDQGEQLVVLGSLHAIGDSFESGVLGDDWIYNSTSLEEFAFFSDEWGSVDGDTALMMHGPRGGVVWTVDISEIENPILSFWHASWEGAGQSLNWYNHVSQNEDDGIILRGIFGYKESTTGGSGIIQIHSPSRLAWLPPEQKVGQWVHYSLNFTELAQQYGDELAPTVNLSFQQIDWYDTPGPSYIANRLLPEVGRGWDAILITSADPIVDWYEFSLEDGETAGFAMTSEGMPAESVLELYDDAGNLLAGGQVREDGILAIDGFRDTTTDGATDKYHVRVGAVVTTPDWPYSLVVTRNAEIGVDTDPFKIVGVTAGTETVGTVPTLDVTFNDALAISSLDAADFLVNGLPVESVRWFNSQTVRIQPRVLSSGTWDVQVAAGALADLQGTPLEAFSASVTVTAADALLSGGLLHETRFLGELDSPGQTDSWQVPLGAGQRMTAMIEVDEALAGSVRLLGPDGSEVAAEAAAVGQLVVVEYTATNAGAYTLAVSGADDTKGEYEGTLHLNAIVEPETLLYTPFKNPTYVSGLNVVFTGELDSPGQTDSPGVGLGAGQTVTATIEVDETLAASVRLLAPDGSEVVAEAAAAGQTLVFEYTAESFGLHTLVVSGANGTTGEYECTMLAEGFFAEETLPGTANNSDANDSAASAVELDPVFFDIAGGAQAAAVRGALDRSTTFVVEEDFNSSPITDPSEVFQSYLSKWRTDSEGGTVNGRPRFQYGEGVLSFPAGVSGRTAIPGPSPLAERSRARLLVPNYYEADWMPTAAGDRMPETTNALTLEFDFRVSDPDVRFTPFSGSFTGEADATGIAIRRDNQSPWHPIWNAPQQPVGEWTSYSIDLTAAAEAAGFTFTNGSHIRFQYHAAKGTEGTGDESIAFDNLVLSDRVYTEDWYRFDVAAGQTASAVADSDESIQIDLLDAQSNVIASGVDGAGVQQVIEQTTANAPGTYYLRATGTGGTYSLAVARDAAADWGQSVTVPEYVAGPRLADHVIPPAVDVDPVDPVDPGGGSGATPKDGGYGQLGAPVEFGEPVSETDLGKVVHREVSGLDLSGGTLSFQLQPTNIAFMTVIGSAADSGTLHLKLKDQALGETLYSVDVDGEQRLDLKAGSDRTYILYVTGTSTNVSLELLNLVFHRGDGVRVHGTDEADHVLLDATSGIDVLVLGIGYHFDNSEALSASFSGGAGDSVTLVGSSGDEEVRLSPDRGEMTGDGWHMSIHDVSSYEVFGGGGTDSAFLNDSAGDDRYESRPGKTTLTGPGFDMTLNDFAVIHAYAKAGGVDTAVLHSPEGRRVKFKSDAEVGYTKLYGSTSFSRAKFFEVVEAYNHADLGVARMFDSKGDDTFYGQKDESRLVSPDYDVTIHGFTQLIAYAKAGGRNTATLNDSPADDEVRFRPHKTQMYDLETKGDVFKLTARAFDLVHAEATLGGNDKAKLHDTLRDDLVEAAGNSARLSSASSELKLLYEAIAFEFVKVYHTEGTDRANVADQLDFELYYDGDWE